MINELLKNHSGGAVISKYGGKIWLFEYTHEQLFRIFDGIKYDHYYTDPVNNDIYIYL